MRVLRWMALAGLAALLVWFLGRTATGALPGFAERVEALGPLGPAAYVATYTGLTVALVPGSILTVAAGALFGIGWGTVYALLGATFGAAAAFLVSRHVARGTVERRVRADRRFDRLDQAVGSRGLRVVLLLRLSPMFPFTLLNYALGLTRVRFADYLAASIGMLPGTLLYVYYGKVIGDVAEIATGAVPEQGPGYYAVLALGLIATLVLTAYVARLARSALSEDDLEHTGAGGPKYASPPGAGPRSGGPNP